MKVYLTSKQWAKSKKRLPKNIQAIKAKQAKTKIKYTGKA